MKAKNILVTGGAGFIGSNFICYFLEKYKDCRIINLDKLTYAGKLSNLDEVKNNENYIFVQGDICDKSLVKKVFDAHNITDVIHFAAESHVDNSISSPSAFIDTNISGTFNLLNQAYRSWMDAPFKVQPGKENNRFHHISTDEVYGSLGDTGSFTEETPYAPNSPYSASKASSDFLVRSYYHTYGMNVVTTNCSNNYGPKQHDEKLIPTIIRNAINEAPIPIYGNGLNIRDWLYVEDHCEAIDSVFQSGLSGETYNIGSNEERTNLDVCHSICDILDKIKPAASGQSYTEFITFVKDRPGHDYRYAIDSGKLEVKLGWKPRETFTSGLEKTVNWYLNKYSKA